MLTLLLKAVMNFQCMREMFAVASLVFMFHGLVNHSENSMWAALILMVGCEAYAVDK